MSRYPKPQLVNQQPRGLGNLVASSQFWSEHYKNVYGEAPPGPYDPILTPCRDLPYSIAPRTPSPCHICDLTPSPVLDQMLPSVNELLFMAPLESPSVQSRRPPFTEISASSTNESSIPSSSSALSELIDREAARKLIGQSGSKGSPAPQKRTRAPVGTKSWTAAGLLELARIAAEEHPFHAPFKQKTKTWEKIRDRLLDSDIGQHKLPADLSADVVRHKVEGLIGYKKDPKSKQKDAKSVCNMLKEEGYEITIQSILEKLETQYDEVKHKTEESKEKAKKKLEEDEAGRVHIRDASMKALGKRGRSTPPVTQGPSKSSNSSLSSIKTDTDEDEDKPVTKRRCGLVRRESSASVNHQMLEIMQKDIQMRREDQKRQDERAEKDQKRADQMVNILSGF
ncbi:hypothetical protein C8J56DRAFT_195721 [Mycena floridula]|nr:hypothetical protein C8J56DRAFT_195721 [Mycena floridula]